LQQRRPDGRWETVRDPLPVDRSCARDGPDFPYFISFSRNVNGPGEREYRIYFPAEDGFTATYEYLIATTVEVS